MAKIDHIDKDGRIWYKGVVEVWPCSKCGMQNPHPQTGGVGTSWGCNQINCPQPTNMAKK